MEYLLKEGVKNKFFKWLFVIFNSDILFPVKGAIIALAFIIMFFAYTKVA